MHGQFASGAETDAVCCSVRSYKAMLGRRPCIHFNFGEGTCPFGSSCFYLHAYPDGTLAQQPALRTVTHSDGTYQVLKEVRLSDFLQ